MVLTDVIRCDKWIDNYWNLEELFNILSSYTPIKYVNQEINSWDIQAEYIHREM